MRRILVGILALASSFPLAGSARAAAAHVNVLDPAMTLVPKAADYSNDYVELTGASGCRVQLWTNAPAGVVLFVRCSDAAPRVALADFLVRTRTAPGPGGTSLATYTAIGATDRALWSAGAPVARWGQVNVDIRIKNLFAYTDAIGAGTTNYTDNLTFTVVMQ